ncbi:Arginyl-tRNA--protein transferase 1 [Coemansia guatemalensis]|uniref:arginyltransferase n=1 Tax=Coemansia guatemalensis TaxID=2761395 RepID=A0A9W8HP51_9FUNG|nr:Arginyl-tRNA--protein transferase 1 [Coemansia guatemalensis]
MSSPSPSQNSERLHSSHSPTSSKSSSSEESDRLSSGSDADGLDERARQNDKSNKSRVQILGMQRRSKCGYCGTRSGSRFFAARSQMLTCADYQALIDRGWRRSGTLLYLTDHSDSCCAYYTIRTHALLVELHASEKKVLRKWRKSQLLRDCGMRPNNSGVSLEDQVLTVADRLQMRLEPAGFSEEKYLVFEKYQRAIHGDLDSTRSGFRRFLCTSPLLFEQPKADVHGEDVSLSDPLLPNGLGSYHQCYYIDGRLVAVGVIDILPRCVSSVYLFYDPDFSDLSLGTYSAMREIALVRELHRKVSSQIEYYYMGYFVPSCPKMTYKARWRPADLLDLITFAWIPIDRCLERIRQHPAFCTFDPSIDGRGLVRDTEQNVLKLTPALDPGLLSEEERVEAMLLEFEIRLEGGNAFRLPAASLARVLEGIEQEVFHTCASMSLSLARRMELSF